MMETEISNKLEGEQLAFIGAADDTPPAADVLSKKSYPTQKIISGFKKELIEFLIRATITRVAFRNYDLFNIKHVLTELDQLRRKVLGENRIKKIAKVDGRYYWDLYSPGWSSKTFNNFIEGEMNRILPLEVSTNRFTNIFVAVTKKCPLKCEHCFEWDALNKKEKLALDDIKQIVSQFQLKGTSQIQITGGEPLLRINDIVEVLKSSKKETDFWVLTSGFNLTSDNAKKLKEAGLTGVVISLDHFDPDEHNSFRGFKNSFDWVQEAVKNANTAKLVTALCICVTRSFVNKKNLISYAELAKKMGVSFIQILEPKAVGHFKGKNVALKAEHQKILETFFLKMNYHKDFKDFPIICYHGYYQRRVGCFASGNRNLYIDTDGDIHACPFCQKKMGSALSPDIDQAIEQLQSVGCHSFINFSG